MIFTKPNKPWRDPILKHYAALRKLIGYFKHNFLLATVNFCGAMFEESLLMLQPRSSLRSLGHNIWRLEFCHRIVFTKQKISYIT